MNAFSEARSALAWVKKQAKELDSSISKDDPVSDCVNVISKHICSKKGKSFAVAGTFVKDIGNGHNIITAIDTFEASGKEEAMGFLLLNVFHKEPEHSIFKHPVAIRICG